MVPGQQVGLVGVGGDVVVGSRGRPRLSGRFADDLRKQRRRDLCGNFVLHRENIVQVAIVGVRPQVKAVVDTNQLRRDPHPVATLAHRPLEDMINIQAAPDLANLEFFALERKRRCSRRHL